MSPPLGLSICHIRAYQKPPQCCFKAVGHSCEVFLGPEQKFILRLDVQGFVLCSLSTEDQIPSNRGDHVSLNKFICTHCDTQGPVRCTPRGRSLLCRVCRENGQPSLYSDDVFSSDNMKRVQTPPKSRCILKKRKLIWSQLMPTYLKCYAEFGGQPHAESS